MIKKIQPIDKWYLEHTTLVCLTNHLLEQDWLNNQLLKKRNKNAVFSANHSISYREK